MYAKKGIKIVQPAKNYYFKQIGKNGLKRTHFIVFRKAYKNKKYISYFISNFKEHILNNLIKFFLKTLLFVPLSKS